MSKTKIGALIGAIIGLAASVVTFLFTRNPMALYVMVHTTILSTAIGTGIGYWLDHRLPEMLPHYHTEHKRLRQLAGRIRANLKRLTGQDSARRGLEEVLAKDVSLRHRATMLKKTIVENAKRSLSWVDRLSGGFELLLAYKRAPGSQQLSGVEWTLRSYRAKLDREVRQIGEQLMQASDPRLSRELQESYRMKCIERGNLTRLEKAIEQIEGELTRIRTSLEAILSQSTRLLHVDIARVQDTSFDMEELFSDLLQEINAFDDALHEVLASSPSITSQPESEEQQIHLR